MLTFDSSRVGRVVSDQINQFRSLQLNAIDWFRAQSKSKKVAIVILGIIGLVVGILALIFHKYAIHILTVVAEHWHRLKHGRIILFTLIFFVGFPPLLGFSLLSMLCGMVYGFPGGWPILALASISGLFASFLLFRYILRDRAERIVGTNHKFRALSEILKEDTSLLLLILIRLCPLPYSLSNGALAAIPNLPATTYLLASVITSPKMFIHVYVGHTIINLGDEKRPASAKIIDLISIGIAGLAISFASYIIYIKMQQKLQTYQRTHPGSDIDTVIFGDFGDIEADGNVELNSADYDADNFIIEDDDDELDEDYDAPIEVSDLLKPSQEVSAERDISHSTYRDY